MNTKDDLGELRKLPATISIITMVRVPEVTIHGIHGTLKPVLSRGANLPTEATHVFSNATQTQSSIEIYLVYGENTSEIDNVSLGRFVVKGIPPIPKGPLQIKIKISVGANQELCLAVIDPATNGYRSVGFIDLSKIDPPAVTPDPSHPWTIDINSIFTLFFGDDPARRQSRRGEDISQQLTISFDEAIQGVQKHTEVLRFETCPACAGSGAQPGTTLVGCADCQGTGLQKTEKDTHLGKLVNLTTCRTCNGGGQTIPTPCIICQGQTRVKSQSPFTVNIPPGVDSGAQIYFPGQGDAGQHGGQSGHLYITVMVASHPLFARIGRDISIHLPIRASFARKGGQLQIPGLQDGSIFLLNLPPNTRHGASFRVFEDESYILNAIIDTYSPYNPIAIFRYQKRLQAINRALNYMGRTFA